MEEHSRASCVLEHSSIGCTYTAYTHRVLVCNLRTDTIGQRERHNLDISISIYIYMSPSSSDASWSDASWSDDDLEQSATLSLSLSAPASCILHKKVISHLNSEKEKLIANNKSPQFCKLNNRQRERERERERVQMHENKWYQSLREKLIANNKSPQFCKLNNRQREREYRCMETRGINLCTLSPRQYIHD